MTSPWYIRAFVITLHEHGYSERMAQRCIDSTDLPIERWKAVDRDMAFRVMKHHDLKWTWAKNNTAPDCCPISKLHQHPYGNLLAKIGCSMSHFELWKYCVEIDEPILILEHDAVFARQLPDVEFKGICQINDPRGATPHGDWWHEQTKLKGPGVHRKSLVMPYGKPDGLAGNSAYLIKPWAAQELIDAFYFYGVWPNDATMCAQLFPYLQELYPYVTKVIQGQSTTT